MDQNKNILLRETKEMEIDLLRQKLKTSNYETLEQCEHLRFEIQKLYFQMARITRPGRHAKKQQKTQRKQHKNHLLTPEVIPPGLDINEFLHTQMETAACSEKKQITPPANPVVFTVAAKNKSPVSNPVGIKNITLENTTTNNLHTSPQPRANALKDRDKTIQKRFSMVAEKMQKRRQEWLEDQNKKRPWWKRKS